MATTTVASMCGRVILAYINDGHVRHGDMNIDDHFVRQDVTGEVDQLLADVEDNIDRMLEVISLDRCPEISTGPSQ